VPASCETAAFCSGSAAKRSISGSGAFPLVVQQLGCRRPLAPACHVSARRSDPITEVHTGVGLNRRAAD